MLQLGRNITSPNDPLQDLTDRGLYELLTSPAPELASKIHQLRILGTIDRKRYQEMKKSLPYVTCGHFSPPYRHSKHFGSISYFMVDIDHIKSKGLEITELQEKLARDEEICLLFVSPGGDGLKLLFKLAGKCYDPARYSLFYKLFVKAFSARYNLDQVIDKATCDVTRACFLSIDHHAYHNPDALPVEMDSYIQFDNPEEIRLAESIPFSKENPFGETAAEIKHQKETETNLSQDLLFQIRQKLSPGIPVRKPKNYYVPGEIDLLLPKVKQKSEELGITMKSAEPINFGKKMVFELDTRWAQLNLFYGKEGYKVVKTPKNGSDTELTQIVFLMICELIYK